MRALLLLPFFILTNPANADMAALQELPSEAIVKALSKKGITEKQREVLDLTKFAIAALSVKFVTTVDGTEPDQVDLWSIKEEIEEAVTGRPWEQRIPAAQEAYIAKNRDFLSKTFGSESYVWAWMRHHTGERDQAKDQLMARYESEFKRIMRMQEQMAFGGNPIREAEAILNVLKAQVTAEQKSAMEAKMRQMKSHVSQLPDSGIMT